jgi:4-hydroxy-4-methyl-2-oxoglutarate aldolase
MDEEARIYMFSELSAQELCDRYERLYTGVVTDVLDDYGYKDQTFDRSIKPISREMSTAGIAYPAVGRTNRSVDSDIQIRRFLEMLGDAPEHSILVMNTNDTTSSHIGELTTTALANQGCRGVVVEGGLRDTEFVLEQDYPVFAQYRTPADSVPRWELVDSNTTTVVGNVSVSPGDVVIGDIDGVVVVPQEIAVDVLHNAEAEKETENQVRATIEEGATPLEAFEEHGTF